MNRSRYRTLFWMPPFHGAEHASPRPLLARQSRIAHLFVAGSPAHIPRCVVAIIVLAIQGQLGIGARANVGIERHETVAPGGADLNPAPAVVPIFSVFRIVAPLNHREPQPILRGRATPVRPRALTCPTATRHRETVAQRTNKDRTFGAARAAAPQVSEAPLPLGFANHSPTANHGSGWDFPKQRVRMHTRSLQRFSEE